MRKTPVLLPALRAGALVSAMTIAASTAMAQQVEELSLRNVPPDLIQADAPAQPGATTQAQARNVQATQPRQTQVRTRVAVDLGQDVGQNAGTTASAVASADPAPAVATTPAARAAQGARVGQVRRVTRAGGAGIERAVFNREPVRVSLPVGQERLITLPATAALHVPTDIEQVARIEVIDRTMYVTALVPFLPLRIVAELMDSGQQVPMDLVANKGTQTAVAELEVSVVDPRAASAAVGSEFGTAAAEGESAPPPPDMVQLTRHAARQLYAPRRLAWATPAVTQVAVAPTAVPGLVRGVDAELVPLGQWRAGSLYVTAVRLTNRSKFPLEVPLEQVRGRWIAATAQHGRVGPAGSETDTTALYLVCERSFEACL